MATITMVQVRVDEAIKAQAAATLADMGLSVSDAVRMLLARVAAERALLFDVRVPTPKRRRRSGSWRPGKARVRKASTTCWPT